MLGRRVTVAMWTLLAAVLVALVAQAAIHDRAGWRALAAGEATGLMQAESLLLDHDLRYNRLDYQRFASRWGGAPSDLDLVSGSDGARIVFDRPFPHALLLAPFLALAPRNGFALLNALLLATAALVAARTLARSNPAAPLVITVALAASVVFAQVFSATAHIFLLALTVMALALVAGQPPGTRRRWALAGVLLSVAAATDPLYALLIVALAMFAGRDRWPLLAGWLAGLAVLVAVRGLSGGGLVHGFDALAFRFTPATGFPLVDFASERFTRAVYELRALHRLSPPFSWGLDGGLWLANLRYLLAGRAAGLLPYFAPLLWLLLAAGRGRVPRAAMVATLLFVPAVLLFRPFDLASAGGPGALANRGFVPFFGALWLVPTRQPGGGGWRRARLVGGMIMTLIPALLAAPFLLPLWRAPGQEPADAAGVARYVSPLAMRLLPLETSQRWQARSPFLEHRGLWVRPLSRGLWVEEGKDRLMVDGAAQAELLAASRRELATLRLAFGAEAPSQIEIEEGILGDRLLSPGGGIDFRVTVEPVAHHPLWWTPEPMWMYHLSFRLPGAGTTPLALRLDGERWVAGSGEQAR